MQITKYPQSNLLLEENGKKLLIDIGNFTLKKYKVDELPTPDAILITHQHPDHMDRNALKDLEAKDIPIYGNSAVVEQLAIEGLKTTKVENGKEFEAAGFKIKPIDLPHVKLLYCDICGKHLGKDVTREKKCKFHPDEQPTQIDGPPNTGFLINGLFFHPGDGMDINRLQVENAAVPITGPTIDFTRAKQFMTRLGIKKAIPMHYTNPAYAVDPKEFAAKGTGNTEVIILEDGQSTQIK